MSLQQRRFTPPCDIEDNGACFIGQALSHVYYENEPDRQAAAGLLTRDEARRVAIKMAKMLELLKRPQHRAVRRPELSAPQ